MQIVEFRDHQLPSLTTHYNALIQAVPHCFPISAADLASAFAGERGASSGEELVDEMVMVALDDDTAIGFVHVGQGYLQEGDIESVDAVIRFLAYPRGRRDVGQALLETAIDWAESRQLPAITAYPQVYRYPFYGFAHTYVSGFLDHIQALLLMNGFEQNGGEVFLDWLEFEPPSPRDVSRIDFELVVKSVQRYGPLPDIRVLARQAEEDIGECLLWNANRFARTDDVGDLAFCQWLGVDEAFQGRGLGAHLLAAALREAKRVGYQHAGISTSFSNYRALLFYSNFGFRAVDWTRRFRRSIATTSDLSH